MGSAELVIGKRCLLSTDCIKLVGLYRYNGLDNRFVDAHLGSLECSDIQSDPRDQHELDPLAHLVSGVNAYEAIQPLVVLKTRAQHLALSRSHKHAMSYSHFQSILPSSYMYQIHRVKWRHSNLRSQLVSWLITRFKNRVPGRWNRVTRIRLIGLYTQNFWLNITKRHCWFYKINFATVTKLHSHNYFVTGTNIFCK